MASTSARRHATWTRWRPRLLDTLLALAVLGATWVGFGSNEALVVSTPDTAVDCLILLSAAAAFIARQRPFAALVIATALDAAPYWLPIGGAGYHLSLMIAIYCVVAYRPGRRALPAVATVVVLQVTLMAWDQDWLWLSMYVAIAALSCLFPIALGLATRSRALAAEALEQRALAAERSLEADAQKLVAEDRLRTARNLHDSVAHQIAVMNLNAGVASQSLRERPDEAETALVTIREAGRDVIASISDLLTSLRDSQETDTEPQHDLADVRELIEEFRQLSPTLTVSIDDQDPSVDHVVSDALYYVVREALTNAYKHGKHAAPVDVRVSLNASSFSVHVVNACAPGTAVASTGFGLTGMQERVAAAGGQVSVERRSGTFTLDAQLPHPGAAS